MQVHAELIWLACLVIAVRGAAIQENAIEEEEVESQVDAQKCPPWDKWQASKCLWPTQNFSSLPKACTSLPKKPKIPAILLQFVQSKQLEIYSVIQNLFKLRGAKDACGYCSRKIRCRQRKGGEWKKGCQYIQAQMVNEECEGSKACVIKPILGACPPPVPMPRPRRKPKPRGFEVDDPDKLQRVDQGLEDKNLEIEIDKKNATQGPPLWHCVRNKDGSQCLCCCGWYFPDAKSGKCVNIRKDDNEDSDDQTWNWSGLMDVDSEYPFGLDSVMNGDQMVDQIEAPPMESVQVDGDDDQNVIDQMPGPPDQQPLPNLEPTAQQVAAPVTDTVIDKSALEKKPMRETNEI